MSRLEQYFEPYRQNTIGYQQTFLSPYGIKEIVYADWTASGRLYRPIEEKISELVGPYVGNTHSESNVTGGLMTLAYHEAHAVIKRHVNAGPHDVMITAGSGMTAVVNKFQRILGLRVAEQLKPFVKLPDELRPVVFITHMEHHSNQTSWIETIADVVVIPPDNEGLVDTAFLAAELPKYSERTLKIGAFTACSNVTGICTPYHELAAIMHRHGGFCFVDFAASAPYVEIDMHPADKPDAHLDAIYFSPHKFLGGPGTSGVLVFNAKLYNNTIPDDPGGGTVDWTNPWGKHRFISNIEAREDGGTPGFLQAIRSAFCVQLKEEIGTKNMLDREHELLAIAFQELPNIHGLRILGEQHRERLGIVSFYVEDIHYNLIVKLLNDRYGIQVRGGCSCAGTYGHYLLHVDPSHSNRITDKIDKGDLSEKPGWVRLSVHPTMTDDELRMTITAIGDVVRNIDEWQQDYAYDPTCNEFVHREKGNCYYDVVKEWFASAEVAA